jgi:hypothetical protein
VSPIAAAPNVRLSTRLGAGAVLLKEALAKLSGLPEEAWERQVVIPALLAVRVQIPQDSGDERGAGELSLCFNPSIDGRAKRPRRRPSRPSSRPPGEAPSCRPPGPELVAGRSGLEYDRFR